MKKFAKLHITTVKLIAYSTVVILRLSFIFSNETLLQWQVYTEQSHLLHWLFSKQCHKSAECGQGQCFCSSNQEAGVLDAIKAPSNLGKLERNLGLARLETVRRYGDEFCLQPYKMHQSKTKTLSQFHFGKIFAKLCGSLPLNFHKLAFLPMLWGLLISHWNKLKEMSKELCGFVKKQRTMLL